jgi:hypothetical protein
MRTSIPSAAPFFLLPSPFVYNVTHLSSQVRRLPRAELTLRMHMTVLLRRGVGVHALLQIDAQLFPYWLEFFHVLVVLALVLYFCFDACVIYQNPKQYISCCRVYDIPSNILTAVGKSLTLRAALRAAIMTEGAGTRS